MSAIYLWPVLGDGQIGILASESSFDQTLTAARTILDFVSNLDDLYQLNVDVVGKDHRR